MTILSNESTLSQSSVGPRLRQIFAPVAADLQAVEVCLDRRLRASRDTTVREIVGSLRRSSGKRLRPVLVLLSSRAVSGISNGQPHTNQKPVWMAAAMELIHMASLVHDDLIDGASVRHHRSSVNARWGGAVSVALGDYLCARAFELVAECGEPQMFSHLGSSLSAMCEGEALQVMSRGDFSLPEQDCLAMVEKKTAALFAACCAAGALATGETTDMPEHLHRFGLHLGIAFQVVDDCKDLLADRETLGKEPAQDLLAGDVTLPLLFLLEEMGQHCRGILDGTETVDTKSLDRVRKAFPSSDALARTEKVIAFHRDQAKKELRPLTDSVFKRSLRLLADYVGRPVSEVLAKSDA